MVRGIGARVLWLSLLLGSGYAIYRGVIREPELKATRDINLSAAASFFSPQGGDDERQIEVRSAPMAALDESAETDEDAAIRTQFRELLKNFDMNQVGATPKTIADLKAICPDKTLLGRLFKDELERLGTKSLGERDNLVWLANSLQTPELLSFWQDLALRRTPRFEDEAKVRNPQRPNLDSRAIDVEQLQAIRNLGLIGSDQAVDTLTRIVVKPDVTAHRTLHREQAFRALQQARPTAALGVLSQLSPNDEVVQRLKATQP